ncbi:SIR2 family NAD-dependent protein deacylase [Paraburkholderia oxyphila]|uniref:SIR2 family NAD-dependent protein deacylase n=1 Tax=Paraburkholderia oxyphila TaxID=614212 RepID=UPI0004849210|nr:SIR2 family protein [Paraburkholderia oxyphila]
MAASSNNESPLSIVVADIIHRIPGGEHLRTVQDALKNGHASVMIGSGFSLNAQGGKRLPTWAKLIDSLLADLYLTEDARKRAKQRFGGTSGMLRLAEEYAAVRGRAQLDSRLHELLPDAGAVMPSDLHTKLLSLFWSDVFTTNYDTLLERALDADRTRLTPRIKPRYQIVSATDDVPLSKRNGRPRIVKLHGSLRSGARMIVTEEDYRTYPVDFAPFVNTVQQSMLENVFCLIGFSGDDPNFLLWTGWARDHLGDKVPPIFLITLSPIPEGQRVILERRKIFPIDIAELGTRNGEVDYAQALGAVLDYWQEEPPPRRAKWPFHNAAHELKAVEPNVSQLVAWLLVAQRNRRDYPGWLVAPANNREQLQDASGSWRVLMSLKANAASIPQWLRLVILSEIVWILETTLSRVNVQVAKLIAEEFVHTVRNASKTTCTLPDSASVVRPSPEEMHRIKARLALEMLRDAREDNDSTEFANWLLEVYRLSPERLPSEFHCFLLHERILFCLEQRDKQTAIDLLNELEVVATRDVDPYWPVRVGALFGEVGVVRRAYDLVKGGLQAIRYAIQFEGEAAYLVSREQWSEWLLGALEYAVEVDDEYARGSALNRGRSASWSPEPGLRKRIAQEEKKNSEREPEEAMERDHNARDNIEHPSFLMDELRYELDIAGNVLDSGAIKFDWTDVPERTHRPLIRDEAARAAVSYIRLVELASLPPSVGRVSFTAKNLLTCYRILAHEDASSNLRVFSRASGGEAASSADALELPIIASLRKNVALRLFQRAIDVIQSITVETRWEDRDASSVKLLLDIASRVAFRLDSEHAVTLCELAMRLYGSQALRDDYSFHDTFAKFFARAVRLLPVTEIARLGPQLLSLSPKSVRFWERRSWPDIVRFLSSPPKLQRNTAWNTAVEQALGELETLLPHDQRHEGGDSVRRLDWLYRAGVMSPSQKRRFASLIWREVGTNDVPRFETFYDAAFISWPMPSEAPTAKARFSRWLCNEKVQPIERMSDGLGESKLVLGYPDDGLLIGLLLTVSNGVSLVWTESELIEVANKLQDWWRTEGKRLVSRGSTAAARDNVGEFVCPRLRLLAHVIHRVFSERLSLEAVQSNKLDEWFKELWDASVAMDAPLIALLFGCLHWWPEQEGAVLDLAINTIQGNSDSNVVAGALSAASIWVKKHPRPTMATRRYVGYLVDGIRSGEEFLLEHKLNAISELLEYAESMHFEGHRHSLAIALYTLLADLLQPKPNEAARFNVYATPLLRVAVVEALVAMGRFLDGCAREPLWLAGMDLARSDPLLVVRKLAI